MKKLKYPHLQMGSKNPEEQTQLETFSLLLSDISKNKLLF